MGGNTMEEIEFRNGKQVFDYKIAVHLYDSTDSTVMYKVRMTTPEARKVATKLMKELKADENVMAVSYFSTQRGRRHYYPKGSMIFATRVA